MVKRILRPLHRWPVVQSLFLRFKRQFTTWPADDFGGLAAAPLGAGLGVAFTTLRPAVEPPPPSPEPQVMPGSVEMLFMRLHSEGRFEEMWEMLAEDAKRAWGGLQNFVREMPRLDQWLEILDMQVASVSMLDVWTDHVHQQTYNNVARLVMRYRVRQQWREWSFDREVHLVPAVDGWRTLCYPMRARAVAGR
jgi:hypothetical protein